MEQKKVSTVKDYQSKIDKKIVELPSGEYFEIKKVTGRDYIRAGGLPVLSVREIAGQSEEKQKEIAKKLTTEQQEKYMKVCDEMLVLATVSPALSIKKENDKICVHDLSDNDYYALLEQITSFSFGRQDLKPFRNEQTASNNRSAGEAIQNASPQSSVK